MNNIEVASNVASVIVRSENGTVKDNTLTDVSGINKKSEDSTKKTSNSTALDNTVTDKTQKSNLTEVVNKINKALSAGRDLNFSVDEGSGQLVIAVYEKGSGELIRQLPSEDALKLLSNLEQVQGVLFNSKV